MQCLDQCNKGQSLTISHRVNADALVVLCVHAHCSTGRYVQNSTIGVDVVTQSLDGLVCALGIALVQNTQLYAAQQTSSDCCGTGSFQIRGRIVQNGVEQSGFILQVAKGSSVGAEGVNDELTSSGIQIGCML